MTLLCWCCRSDRDPTAHSTSMTPNTQQPLLSAFVDSLFATILSSPPSCQSFAVKCVYIHPTLRVRNKTISWKYVTNMSINL